jgi:hypothetical protein
MLLLMNEVGESGNVTPELVEILIPAHRHLPMDTSITQALTCCSIIVI